MFEEMRLAALLAKGISGNPVVVPARTALTMATRMGANAIHIGDRTGSLETGKRADLLLLDLAEVHSSPKFERNPDMVYSRIVYSAKACDVTDLMVNGKWLMRNRALQTLPETDLLARAAEMALRLDAFLTERESSVLSKLIAIETAAEEESFEVQVKVKLAEDFPLLERMNRPEVEILYDRHYREYDTYFEFSGAGSGPAALPRRPIRRGKRRGGERALPPDAHRADARARIHRRGAALALAVPGARHAWPALLPGIFPTGAGNRSGQGAAALEDPLPQYGILRQLRQRLQTRAARTFSGGQSPDLVAQGRRRQIRDDRRARTSAWRGKGRGLPRGLCGNGGEKIDRIDRMDRIRKTQIL